MTPSRLNPYKSQPGTFSLSTHAPHTPISRKLIEIKRTLLFSPFTPIHSYTAFRCKRFLLEPLFSWTLHDQLQMKKVKEKTQKKIYSFKRKGFPLKQFVLDVLRSVRTCAQRDRDYIISKA